MTISIKSQIIEILCSAKISRTDALDILNSAFIETFAEKSFDGICPFYENKIIFLSPGLKPYTILKCEKCLANCLAFNGTLRAKRHIFSGMMMNTWGLNLRFLDHASKDKHIFLQKFFPNSELRSKDNFTLCVGTQQIKEENSSSNDDLGKVALINISIGRIYISKISNPQN